jgi:hypothetical protein
VDRYHRHSGVPYVGTVANQLLRIGDRRCRFDRRLRRAWRSLLLKVKDHSDWRKLTRAYLRGTGHTYYTHSSLTQYTRPSCTYQHTHTYWFACDNERRRLVFSSTFTTITILPDVLRRLTNIDDYLQTSYRRLMWYYPATRLFISTYPERSALGS